VNLGHDGADGLADKVASTVLEVDGLVAVTGIVSDNTAERGLGTDDVADEMAELNVLSWDVLNGTERLDDEDIINKLDEDVSATEDDDEVDELEAEMIAEADELDVENALDLELLDRPIEEDVRVEDWPGLLEELTMLHLPKPFWQVLASQ
jgi:hypothetical protein